MSAGGYSGIQKSVAFWLQNVGGVHIGGDVESLVNFHSPSADPARALVAGGSLTMQTRSPEILFCRSALSGRAAARLSAACGIRRLGSSELCIVGIPRHC